MRPKIAFFEIESWEENYVRNKTVNTSDLTFLPDSLDIENVELAQGFDIVSPFIYSDINRDVIENLPSVRLIATRSTGYDHIDVDYCAEKGISVTNVPVYGENTVAEHTFALILALSRKIMPSVERTRRGNFSLEGLRGFDLKNRVLGVVGAGHIGQHVMRIGHGFQMEIIAYDMRHDELLAKNMGFHYVPLNELLKKADTITLHVPYNPQTHHLINRKNISLLKQGSMLINTARGGLVETAALVEAIRRGVLVGVGLDVIEEESIIKEERQLLTNKHEREELRIALETYLLLFRDDVIITPHNAFNSTEAVQRILDTTITNIETFIEGRPQNMVRLKAA